MVKENVKVLNKHGLHTRPATVFVTTASQFNCEVFIHYKGIRVNAKSILGILILAVEPGSEITIETNGDDEKEALKALVKLTQQKFNLE